MTLNPVGLTTATLSLPDGVSASLQSNASAEGNACPAMPRDQIAQHPPAPRPLDDYRSAIATAAAATWGAAQRGSAELAPLGEVGAKVGSAALGAIGEIAGPIGIIATTQTAAGNPGESAPNAAWRASSKAVSDRTPMALHPTDTYATGKPISPPASIEHTGATHPAADVSSTTTTPDVRVDGSTTTSPINRSGGSTSVSPVTHRPIASDAATLVVNAHDTALALPGWRVEPQNVTRTDGEALRAKFDRGERQAFVKDLAANHREELHAAGITDAEIDRMAQTGRPVEGFQVHHIVALSQGGTNDRSNLILLHFNNEHSSITGQQNSAMRGMSVGESRVIDILKPPVGAHVYLAPQSADVVK